jgi:dCTP deaminase
VLKAFHAITIIDPRQSVAPLMQRFECEEVIIYPGQFILGSTIERVTLSSHVVSRIEGKSSLGRLGLTVHSTAGFIDPGNTDLSVTLELFNQSPHPIRLYKGMWICQLSFQWTDSPCDVSYGVQRKSRYYGDHEPVPSKIELNSGVE